MYFCFSSNKEMGYLSYTQLKDKSKISFLNLTEETTKL